MWSYSSWYGEKTKLTGGMEMNVSLYRRSKVDVDRVGRSAVRRERRFLEMVANGVIPAYACVVRSL